MDEPSLGVVVGDGLHSAGEGINEGLSGSGSQLSKGILWFRPALFDRIQVWTVGRLEDDLGPNTLDRFSHVVGLVSPQVVEDDDVSWQQRRQQDVGDVGQENDAIEVALNGEDGIQAIQCQCADDRLIATTIDGLAVIDTLILGAPGIHRRHGQRAAGFIDEDQSRGFDGLHPVHEVFAGLLAFFGVVLFGPERLFLRVHPMRRKVSPTVEVPI